MLTNSARLRVTYRPYTFREQRCQIFTKETASPESLSNRAARERNADHPDVSASPMQKYVTDFWKVRLLPSSRKYTAFVPLRKSPHNILGSYNPLP